MKRLIGTILLAALFACALTTASASAALVADYRFDDNLNSSGGLAPPLTEVGTGGAVYQTENVNGAIEKVRVFPAGAGLSLAADGLVPHDSYTFELTFKFGETSTWERIFDASNASADNGLYVKNNKLSYYDNHDAASADHFGSAAVSADTYTTVTISRSPGGLITIYQDGVLQIAYNDVANTGVLKSPDFPARFFIDDNVVSGENSPGAVARIRVFDTEVPYAPPGGDKNATVTKVQCNYLVASGLNTCIAQVGDARPGSTKRPTGRVMFSSAKGSFLGNSCELVPTPASRNVSSCSVQYLSPTSSFPKVAAAYQGSAEHAPSSGVTTFYILGGGSSGFGVELGQDPTFRRTSSDPVTVGCSAGAAKSAQAITAGITVSYECMMKMSAAFQEAKNKAIGKPCDGPIKTYADIKDCNPRYQEALEEWERKEQETVDKLDDLIRIRKAKWDELNDIMDDYHRSVKDILGNARRSVTVAPRIAKTRKAKSILIAKARVVVKGGKQKTVRLKLTRQSKPILTFVRRMNKALPSLNLTVNVTLRTEVTTRRSKKAKPKRKVIKRVVAYGVSP